MNREQLEYSISRHIDGTLPATERLSLDIRLNQDAEARALLAEYRAFDESLSAAKEALPPLPEIDWDAFANQISSAIDHAQETGDVDQPAVIGRIGFARPRTWMAIAASLLIAAGISFSILRTRPTPGPIPKTEVAAAIEINVVNELPADELAVQSSPVVVAIGPSSDSDGEPALWRYADDVVSRSPHMVIASGNRPAQDSFGFPN